MKFNLFISFFCLISCTTFKAMPKVVDQGVAGQVTYSSGNQMPSPDVQRKKPIGVMRWIYIYELTKMNQVSGQAPMYSAVSTRQVAKVKSDSLGYFQCKLNPGKYSIFVLEDKSFFANQTDNEGAIAAFEVKAGKVTLYNLLINHKAFY
ncbi:MAG: carboxypeptidase regulatory-like domain-containing protein [Pedobacter sp.]|nr:MAG: carboxypeptidase regulatory-like domain-containing protein [Pedobacter sp.]